MITRLSILPTVVWPLVVALFLGVPFASHAEEKISEFKVQEEVDEALAARRAAMLEEAHAALDETNAALQLMEEGNSEEALEALARATGKLELLVARDPRLALAPVDVAFTTYDIYATPEAIRAARDEAEDLLEDGKVQRARALLSGLASEIVISVTNMPLATYPDAIKAISPLIDEGKTEEAKAALRAALGTLVVTDQVIPLPILRARHLLESAEQLAMKEAVPEEDKKKISESVEGARAQLEIAELLGYGDKKSYRKFEDQIAELETKIHGGDQPRGAFAQLRKSLGKFQAALID